MKKQRLQLGFTLIELLLVIAIIAALAVTVFVALNPGQRIQDANNARRTTDADTILSAVHSYIVDSDGSYPTSLPTIETQIGTATTGCAVSTGGCGATVDGCANMDADTVLDAYLASFPLDPVGGTAAETNYTIIRNSTTGIITVRACGGQGATISVAR